MLKILAQRVSGDQGLRLRTFCTFLPFGVLGVVLLVPNSAATGKERALWLLIGVIAAIIMGATVLILNLIFKFYFQKKRFAKIFILSALFITGAIRGVVINQSAPIFGLSDEINWLSRAINSGIFVVIWMGIIGLIYESQSNYLKEYQDLYQRFLLLKLGQRPDGKPLNSGRLSEISRLIAEMTSPVRNKLAEIDSGDFSKQQINQAVNQLQKMIKEELRPLSHRLWFDRDSYLLKFKIRNFFFDAIKSGGIPSTFFISVITFTIFISLTSKTNIVNSLIVSAIFACSIFLLLALEKLIFSKTQLKKNYVHLITLLMIITLPIYFSDLFFNLVNIYSWNIFAIIGVSGAIFITAILTTMLSQSFLDRVKIIDTLSTQLTSSYVEEHLLAIARMAEDSQIASYLHSSLQSELTAIALKLDQAARLGDREQVRSIIAYAQIVMTRDLNEDFQDREISPLKQIAGLKKAWSGIAKIKIDLQQVNSCGNKVLSDISKLIEEAVSDSVRFGNANSFVITGDISVNHYYIKVADNGLGSGKGGSGLGTILLDEIAPNSWRREFGLAGTVLEVWLPLTTY